MLDCSATRWLSAECLPAEFTNQATDEAMIGDIEICRILFVLLSDEKCIGAFFGFALFLLDTFLAHNLHLILYLRPFVTGPLGPTDTKHVFAYQLTLGIPLTSRKLDNQRIICCLSLCPSQLRIENF
ncbi:hypothetical protein D3C81_1666120 [compost metagenome]